MKPKHDYTLMCLTKWDLVGIFVIYAILMIGSISMLLHQLLSNSANSSISGYPFVIVLASSSLAGSSTFYTRKLYKSAINTYYNFEESRGKSVQRIGTIAFFLFRPLYGLIFAIVSYALWRASISASTNSAAQTNDLMFVVITIGFFSGFSAGKLVEKFEERETDQHTNERGNTE
ncbi:MAG: hypothetical protein QE484_00010 [Rhizobium sp.]|nr:hypothetical protein [Rhizobium sp.]